MRGWTKKDEAAFQKLEPVRQAGYAAAAEGKPYDVCPYDFELVKRSAWLTGHENWHREQRRQTST